MSPRTLTIGLLVFFVVFFSLYDLWAAQTPGATISEIVIGYFYRHPVVPFTLGCLLGHLTFPSVTTRPHTQTIVIVCACLALAEFSYWRDFVPPMLPVIPLVLGIPFGRVIWPQRSVVAMSQIETPKAITPTPAALQ